MTIELSKAPRNSLVYVCKHVFQKIRPVRLVVYEDNGDLCMLCGESDHSTSLPEELSFHGVGLGHLVDADMALSEVPPLKFGDIAERPPGGGRWRISKK